MPLAQRFNQNGKVIVMSETTDEPLTLAGYCAGVCWNADVSDPKKNFKRGLQCLKDDHGKVLEYAQVYLILDGWSARVIREVYTHNSGLPSRLQASTRYVDYSNFAYVCPRAATPAQKKFYADAMAEITEAAQSLEDDGMKREDAALLLPLGMQTKVVYRTNLRALIDMAKVRMCTRAYWEYRELMDAILEALSIYSDEWKYLVEDLVVFAPKCTELGYCPESKGCGRFPKIGEVKNAFQLVQQTIKSKTLTQEEIISAINSAAALKEGELK